MSNQRQRPQRFRHDAGSANTKDEQQNVKFNPNNVKTKIVYASKEAPTGSGTNVAVAESKDYEAVTYMDSNLKPQTSAKFSKRPIVNTISSQQRDVIDNWQNLDPTIIVDEEIDLGEDYLLGEDFAEIIELNETCGGQGGFLHLKEEKSWGNIDTSYGIGDLKVSELVDGFATIPFHELMNIPKDMLPASSIKEYIEIAEKHKSTYSVDNPVVSVQELHENTMKTLTVNKRALSEENVRPSVIIQQPQFVELISSSGIIPSKPSQSITKPIYNFKIVNNSKQTPSMNQPITQAASTGKYAELSDEIFDKLFTSTNTALKQEDDCVIQSPSKEESPIQGQTVESSNNLTTKIDPDLEDWLESVIGD